MKNIFSHYINVRNDTCVDEYDKSILREHDQPKKTANSYKNLSKMSIWWRRVDL